MLLKTFLNLCVDTKTSLKVFDAKREPFYVGTVDDFLSKEQDESMYVRAGHYWIKDGCLCVRVSILPVDRLKCHCLTKKQKEERAKSGERFCPYCGKSH